MASSFALKLSLTNIRQNRKFYVPYILASTGTIIMFYIMAFLTFNEATAQMSAALATIMMLGLIVIGIFAIIFLFYTNSFLMKRRKKELGLYNVLGMEKKHIGEILFFENSIICITSMVLGLIIGILFSKLTFVILCKLVGINTPMVFEISGKAIIVTVVVFAAIFFMTLLSNLGGIHISNPIELLNGSKVGEKEPKTKLLMAIIGAICIGTGYTIAITVESPLSALALFFVAVILVIVGTYLLFTTGSIVILKMLKKNKNYYYKSKHFTTVSGMLYRMKQNAIGLANICILSTMVLVMVSTTVCLYIGTEDMLNTRYNADVIAYRSFDDIESWEDDNLKEKAIEISKEEGRTIESIEYFKYLAFSVSNNNGKLSTDTNNYSAGKNNINQVLFITADEYRNLTGESVSLKDNEVIAHSSDKEIESEFTLFNKEYIVKERISKFANIGDVGSYLVDAHYFVVANKKVLCEIYEKEEQAYGDNASGISAQIEVDVDGTDDQKIQFANSIRGVEGKYHYQTVDSKQEISSEMYELTGGFLFIGLFLGLLFSLATVMIIYYKQISEGYYDKDKFEIMQKVGMSKGEVKKTIREQVLTVFYLPLVMAGIHVMAAFKMITRLLLMFALTNVKLFAICTVTTFIVFAIIYALVYTVTAREYYKIVK